MPIGVSRLASQLGSPSAVKAIGAMAVSTTAVDSCRGRGFRSELRAVIVVDGAYFRNRLGEASPRDEPRFWVFGIEKVARKGMC